MYVLMCSGTDLLCLMGLGRNVSMKPVEEISLAKDHYWDFLSITIDCCLFFFPFENLNMQVVADTCRSIGLRSMECRQI